MTSQLTPEQQRRHDENNEVHIVRMAREILAWSESTEEDRRVAREELAKRGLR